MATQTENQPTTTRPQAEPIPTLPPVTAMTATPTAAPAQTRPTIQPQPSPTNYRSATMDAILNARKQPALRPDVRTRTQMDLWNKSHPAPNGPKHDFAANLRPYDPSNPPAPAKAAQTPVNLVDPHVSKRLYIEPAKAAPHVPTFGEDLRNELQAIGDIFRKPENRKYNPNLGKYTVPPPKEGASPEEWIKYYHDKADFENGVEKKRQERNRTIGAIGDTINALSSLYYTTQYAPPMYDPRNSMSDRQQARYDKLNAAKAQQDQAWLNAYLQQAERDRQHKEHEDTLQFQKDNAAANDARLKEEFNLNLEAAAKENERKRKGDIDLENLRHEHNRELARIKAEAGGGGSGSGSGGKNGPVPLADGNGSQYSIPKSVWDNNYPRVFEAIKPALKKSGYRDRDLNSLTSAQKEDLVKQYWYISDDAKDLLLNYSGIDPNDMESVTERGTVVRRGGTKPVRDAE